MLKMENQKNFATTDSEQSVALGKKQYSELTRLGKLEKSGNHNNKYIAPVESSMRLSFMKNIAIGKSGFNSAGNSFSFKSYNTNDSNRALRKSRSGGYVVPPKSTALENTYSSFCA